MKANLKGLCVSRHLSIKEAMRVMGRGARRTLFVVDEEERLLGVLTDGDIRRRILDGGELNQSITDCFTKNAIWAKEGEGLQVVKEMMLKMRIEGVPFLDQQGRLLDVAFWDDVFDEKENHRHGNLRCPVVIMAGGKGTRLEPFTKILPKPLIPIGEKPIIELIMDRFSAYGVSEFSVIVNYKKEMIKSYFDNAQTDYNVTYLPERVFSGTAGSLRLLTGLEEEEFILSNCDVLIDADFCDFQRFHREGGYCLTMVGAFHHHRIPYGVIEFTNRGLVERTLEKPEYDFTINAGLYMLKRECLQLIPEDGFFHITDLIDTLLASNKPVGVYPIKEDCYVDIGQWEEYHQALRRFGMQG